MKFIIINKLQIAFHMTKYDHVLPNCVDEMFSSNNTNHPYNTLTKNV